MKKFRWAKEKLDGFQILKQIHGRIDQLSVKKGVDEMGIDRFVSQCAWLAAGSGVLTGLGGGMVAIVGMPLDTLNLLAQQFRVTIAVKYHRTGNCACKTEDIISVLSASVNGDIGLALGKHQLDDLSKKLLIRMGFSGSKRFMPIVGAVVGGSANYLFIRKSAELAMKAK